MQVHYKLKYKGAYQPGNTCRRNYQKIRCERIQCIGTALYFDFFIHTFWFIVNRHITSVGIGWRCIIVASKVSCSDISGEYEKNGIFVIESSKFD